MSGALALLVVVVAGILALLVAQRTQPEPVGTTGPQPPQGAGHHATATSWLMTGPVPAAHHIDRATSQGPTDRLVRAIVHRRAAQDGTGIDVALDAVLGDLDDPVADAVLRGRMGRAQRAMARRMHGGPEGAFAAWYVFVALPRYGRRGLRNAALHRTAEACA